VVLRSIISVVLLGLVVFGAVACGGGESAGDSARTRIEQGSQGEYDKVWESLHPAQKAVVPEDLFIRCSQENAQQTDPTVDKVDITSVKTETKEIPEVGSVEVQVVSAVLHRGDTASPRIWNMVKADGSWRWVLASQPLEKFRSGQCP
jgi:hypothetical protein